MRSHVLDTIFKSTAAEGADLKHTTQDFKMRFVEKDSEIRMCFLWGYFVVVCLFAL